MNPNLIILDFINQEYGIKYSIPHFVLVLHN